MSICVSCPARVDASDDWMRAAVALLDVDRLLPPGHCADSYVLQAVATAAMASRTVAKSFDLLMPDVVQE